jgi:alpha-tubulin suppressor-like RCC1 family protein
MTIIFGPGISLGAGMQVLQEPPTYLWAWGKNDLGQLGLGNTANTSSPVQVGALGTWSQIDGPQGGNFTQAVKTDGTLWAWGDNGQGQLGLGDAISRSSPVQVGALTNWSNSLMPNGQNQTATMVKSDGSLWLVGNASYIFSTGFGINRSSPVQVASDKTWAVSTATAHQGWFGITTGGQLWSSMGSNLNGESGQNNTTNTSSPAQVGALTNWAGVYPLYFGAIARKTDGTLWSWGKAYPANPKAAQGQNDGVTRSSPTQIGALTTWARVSTSKYNVLAVKTDGTFWTWGYNGSGASGLGDAVNRSSPTQVGALTGWSTAANKNEQAGSPAVISVKSDGSLWTWGRAYHGTLGNGTGGPGAANKSSPVQVGSLTTWTKVGANYNSAFAIANHAT